MRRTLMTFAALVASASAFAPTGLYTGRSMQFACLALPSCVMSPLSVLMLPLPQTCVRGEKSELL